MISIEKEERAWRRFFVLHDEPTYKLKRIEVDPGDKIQSSSWLLKNNNKK